MTGRDNPLAAIWSRAHILLALTMLFWAGNSIVGRAARDLVPPAALSFWRWAIALMLLLPFAWPHLKRDWSALRAKWLVVLVLGGLGIGAFNTLLYTGLQTTTALNAMLLQSGQPALILILGAVLMGDRIGMRQVAGALVALSGVLFIIAQGEPGRLLGLQLHAGDAIIGVAVIVWSLYSVGLRKRPDVHPFSFLAASIIVGIAVIAPVYVMEIASGRLIRPESGSALAIAYVSVFPSFLAYLFFNRGVELIGSAAAGQYTNLMPVMGAGLAILFLGERLFAYHVAGLLLVVAGLVIAGRGSAATPQPSASST